MNVTIKTTPEATHLAVSYKMPPDESAPRTQSGFSVRTYVALIAICSASFLLVGAFLTTAPEAHRNQVAAAAVPDPFANLAIEANAALVVDLTTGKTLYARNAQAQLPLASITKVMLALVVDEVLPQDSIITVPRGGMQLGSSTLLAEGGHWRTRDLMRYTLVASSNEGAAILAEAADGALAQRYREAPRGEAALWRMNTLAKEIGLAQTYFLNVSGLDVSSTLSGAYGSALDVARLFAFAVAHRPELFAGTARNGVLLSEAGGETALARNTNTALGSIPGLVMGKTGYTDLAGGNLAVVFEAGPARPVAAVVLGSTYEGRFADMRKLVAAARASIMQE